MMQEDGSKAELPVKVTVKDGKKPAEVFRTDLITAMKIPDHQLVTPGTYFDLHDSWKQEWEKGVQVPVNKESLPQPSFNIANSEKPFQTEFRMPYKLVKCGKKKEIVPQKSPLYDLDDEDVEWLKALNKSRKNQGLEVVDELLMEKAIGCLEDQCYTNMGETISTAKGLSIEYDEEIACDICRSPECEDGNEILFCDVCDVAVHQTCYGVQKVPIGSWVCKPCTQLLSDCPCLLCSTRGGAMKKTKTKGVEGWVHMSCALWIPEVGIGNVEKMEPITRIETITPGRWNLLCYICKEKRGACIQCSVKSCVTAFHVTCGFDNSLHMQTVWDDSAPDGVRHVCYCSKHTEKRSGRSPRKSSSSLQSPLKSPQSPLKSPQNPSPRTTPSKSSSSFRAKEQEEREDLRENRLRGMEEEFYKYADVEDLADELNITTELATTFHRFWTLKRKGREDAALLPPTAEQQERLSGRQIKPFQKATMEVERVVRLRQDLERIRNLCYMVEKREKQKRELTAAREAVFRKELEVVDDTSGKMSTEDIQWARSCCVKNFTEYEELQTLDLRCPAKPKVYKKRGRKPKRRSMKTINGFVQTGVMSQSDGITSEYSGECEESDSAHQNKDSTFCSSDSINDHLDNEGTTSRVDVPSNCTSSCDNTASNIDEKTLTLRSNPSARSGRSTNDNISSDSDFEDESARKAKRRASISQLQMRKLSKSDTEMIGVTRSSDAESPGSSSMHTQGSSPVQLKARLNGLNVSARVNLLEIKDGVKNRLCRSPNNVAGRQFKRNRKRLFCELSEKHDESQSPRTLRSNGTIPGEQLTFNSVSEKRVCRPNGILDSKSNEKTTSESNPLNNDVSQSEESGQLEVHFTRSRSRTSAPDSPKSSFEQNDVLHTVDKQSEKNGNIPELCRTRSHNSRAVSTSTSSTINGVLCTGKSDENAKKDASQLAHDSLSNHDEVSDISSRTRSRSNTLDSASSPVKKDIDVSHILPTAQNTETNCKRDSARKEVIAERCRTLRRPARLSDNVGASKATLYSPTKCSRFFGKLRQAATTTA